MSELLTVREVAAVMKCSQDAVVHRFAKMDGVIDLGRGETRDKRRYRVLRIPKAVVEAYLSKKAGRSIQIEVPERAEQRRKSPNWEARAIRNLAKAGLQNECHDPQTYMRIANRARLLVVHVPENRWAEIEWFEDE